MSLIGGWNALQSLLSCPFSGGDVGEVTLTLAQQYSATVIAYGPAGIADPVEDGQVATIALADPSGTDPDNVRYRIRGGGAWLTALNSTGPDFAEDTTEALQGPDVILIEAVCTFSDASVKVISGAITVDETANEGPTVAAPISDVTGTEGDADVVIDLDDVFADDGGDGNLTYSLVGSPASASLAGTRNKDLTVSRAAVVSETVTVRATDAGALTADDVFDVTVEAAAEMPTIVATSTLVLDDALTRLTAYNPLIRNSNVASAFDELKIGPRRMIKTDQGRYRAYVEVIENTDGGGFNDLTAAGLYHSQDGLVWPANGENPVLTPPAGGWTAEEFSPTMPLYDEDKWKIFGHGGNNSQPRVIGRYDSTDGATGEAFTAVGQLLAGTTSEWDDGGIADAKIVRFAEDDWRMLYRRATAPGIMGIAYSSDRGATWTKYSGNPVISNGAAASWNEDGIYAAGVYLDPGNRVHIWACGEDGSGVTSVGYYYSDDGMLTWTPGASNPVWEGTGNTADPDYTVGDTVDVLHDGTALVVTAYGLSTSFGTNPPLRSAVGAWMLLPAENPTIPCRYFPTGAGVNVPAAATLLTATIHTVGVRFKMWPGSTFRSLWMEEMAFNKQSWVRVTSAGLLECYHRVLGNEITITSARRVDDNQWHEVLFVRTSGTAAEVFLDGVSIGTSAVNAGSTTGTSQCGMGNWNSGLAIDEPAQGWISHLLLVSGTALTAAQGATYFSAGTLPGGVTAHVDYRVGSTGTGTEDDQSTNARDGTVFGTTTICSGDADEGIEAVPSPIARSFGSGEYLIPPDAVTTFGSTVFTVVARIRVPDAASFRHIYTEQGDAFNKEVTFRLTNTGLLHTFWRTPTGIAEMTGAVAVDDGNWHNVALVRTATNAWRQVVDGSDDGTSTTNAGTTTSSPLYIAIGNWGENPPVDEPLLGDASHFAVWLGGALSNAEIEAYLNTGQLPSEGLPTYEHRPGTANPEPDLSGNGNGSAVVGTTLVYS